VYPHTHAVNPVRSSGRSFYSIEDESHLTWTKALQAYGRIEGAALSGTFLVDFQFTEQELKNWLTKYIEEQPHEAFKLIAEAQTDALAKLGGFKSEAQHPVNELRMKACESWPRSARTPPVGYASCVSRAVGC